MRIEQQVKDIRATISNWKNDGLTVAFVPTMGNLHEGHLALVDKARAEADRVIVSIYVNPMQFGAGEDLDAYPRTLQDDQRKLQEHGCDLLFTPTDAVIYPNGKNTRVEVLELTGEHCGSTRPDHFLGVTTVVTKLFNIVQPNLAIFGKKDYQQLAVIRKMTKDLFMPIEIIGLDTIREPSGLAKSSRNGYLTPEQTEQASELRAILLACKAQLKQGDKISAVKKQAIERIEEAGFTIDYLNIADQENLENLSCISMNMVILAAAYLGSTRLIDNIEVNL
jgi:pantoate--beta-alanine ligase